MRKSREKIYNKCPECPNEEFEILSTVRKGNMYRSGLYRVKCTVCDFIETVKSKSPTQDSVENPPDNMNHQDQIDYQNWLDKERSNEDS